jgi:hypothetical protein
MVRKGYLFVIAALLLGASLADFGQQTQTNDKKDTKKEPAPLFGGKMGIKSSSTTKETASLGFNGIDPSGKVDAKMLATTPSAEHEAKAKQLAALVPAPAALADFLKEGGLKSK